MVLWMHSTYLFCLRKHDKSFERKKENNKILVLACKDEIWGRKYNRKVYELFRYSESDSHHL